jgi:4-hydroxybenzoate polyprenyltransferase
MVWNDFFDIEQDRRERPFRPLPSGAIARRTAGVIGGALLAAGVLLAALAGAGAAYLAGLLAAAILLYDAWLKRTWAGPLGMGTCRFLNILLGLSMTTPRLPDSGRALLALVIGLYIAGVTWFGRTEARLSNRATLQGGSGVMFAALVLALTVPAWLELTNCSVLFPYLLVGLGFSIGIPMARALAKPAPPQVQAAVKRALTGLVVLDTALACAFVGTAGLALLILLLPLLYLGRWIYMT